MSDVEQPYDDLFKEISQYKIGQYRTNLDPYPLPKSINIGIFGNAGSGKSSLINTLVRCISDSQELLLLAEPSSGHLSHGTYNYKRFKPESKLPIFLYDSRGLNFINVEEEKEVARFIVGLGCFGYINRPNDGVPEVEKKMIQQYALEYKNNVIPEPLHAVIVTISANSLEPTISSTSTLIKQLKSINCAFCVAVTHPDRYEPPKNEENNHTKEAISEQSVSEQLKAKFSEKLNINVNNVFVIANYIRRGKPRDKTMEREVLSLMKYSLQKAEWNLEYTIPEWKKIRSKYDTLKSYIEPYAQYIFFFLLLLFAVLYFQRK